MDDVLADPRCSECGGVLSIVDRDGTFMIVVCADCGGSHGVEITTGEDGNPVYWPAFRISVKGDDSRD